MMRGLLILCFATVALCAEGFAQSSKFFTSSDPAAPVLIACTQDAPGCSYFAGDYWQSPTICNMYVAEVDTNGQFLWQRVSPYNDRSESVQEMDADSKSIYVAGTSEDTLTGMQEGLIARFTLYGDLIWRIRITGGPMYAVECLPDGGIIAVGGQTVVRMDSLGAVRWFKHDTLITGPDYFYNDVCADSTDAFYCIGTSDTGSSVTGGVITKCDSLGNVIWSKRYGSPSNPYAFLCGLVHDSTLYIAGRVMWPSPNGNFDALLMVHLDTSGTPINWTMSSTSSPIGFECAELILTPAHTLAIAGRTYDVNGFGNSPFIAEFDIYSFTFLRGIYKPTSNNFLRDISMDASGNTSYCGYQWSAPDDVYYGITGYTWLAGCGFTTQTITLTNVPLPVQNLIALRGQPFGWEVYGYTYPVPVIWNVCTNGVGFSESKTSNTVSVFPNPTDETCTIQFEEAVISSSVLELTDATGKLVLLAIMDEGMHTLEISTATLPDGMYFLKSQDGFVAKIVVVH